MGAEDIFNYVMETPGNTNPNVLRSLLDNLDSGTSLPDNPTQDGTYNLQNTVSSGTGTLSWASGGSSGGGVLVVNITYDEGTGKYTCDKTAAEIWAANPDNRVVFVEQYEGGESDNYLLMYWFFNSEGYGFFVGSASSELQFYAVNGTDYPQAINA